MTRPLRYLFFFFNDTATTEIYTLSLHDALPISQETCAIRFWRCERICCRGYRRASRQHTSTLPRNHLFPAPVDARDRTSDRKSTRLNSSHSQISYAVFCLKKKKIKHHSLYIIFY